MYLPRHVDSWIRAAIREFPIVALLGARQTGKSTTLQHVLGGSFRYVTFDSIADREAAHRDPELFLSNFVGPTIFDEVQYVPSLFSALKRRVDAKQQPGMFVLTGSQQLHIISGLRESLVGRVLLSNLHPMTAWERAGLGDQTHWLVRLVNEGPAALLGSVSRPWQPLRELIRGGLPGVLTKSDAFLPDYFKSYVTTYLERDLRSQHAAADPMAMSAFLRLLAPLSAQPINRSQLGREIGVSSPTSARWLAWLTGANLWRELPAFDGNAIKRVAKAAKGMLFDTGLICHLLQAQRETTLQSHPLLGSVFETAVALELRAIIDASLPGASLYHWRTPYGHEVDAVIEHEGRLFAFECKWSSNVSCSAVAGLTAFRRTFGERVAATIVVTPIGDRRWIDRDILQVPWGP